MEANIFLGKIKVNVGFREPGGIIINKPIRFDVSCTDSHYVAVPLCSEADRRLANLPEALEFTIEANKIQSLRGTKEGNLEVIVDIVSVMQKEELISSSV